MAVTPERWSAIRQEWYEGKSFTDLAKKYRTSHSTISRYAKKNGWIRPELMLGSPEAALHDDPIIENVTEVLISADSAAVKRNRMVEIAMRMLESHRQQTLKLHALADRLMQAMAEAMQDLKPEKLHAATNNLLKLTQAVERIQLMDRQIIGLQRFERAPEDAQEEAQVAIAQDAMAERLAPLKAQLEQLKAEEKH